MALKGCDGATSVAATSLPNGGEAVLVTLGPIDVPADSVRVLIFGYCAFAAGAGVTAINCRVRRGPTITDTLVQVFSGNIPQAASVPGIMDILVLDSLTTFGTVTYSLTGGGVAGAATNSLAGLFVLFV